jgi:hypothetical protein
MIERLDHAMNVIGLFMVIFGGLLSIWNPTSGNTILSAGVGVLGNSAVRSLASQGSRSTDPLVGQTVGQTPKGE